MSTVALATAVLSAGANPKTIPCGAAAAGTEGQKSPTNSRALCTENSNKSCGPSSAPAGPRLSARVAVRVRLRPLPGAPSCRVCAVLLVLARYSLIVRVFGDGYPQRQKADPQRTSADPPAPARCAS